MGRIPMNANDYARDWYSCDEVDGDFQLKYFNIDRDKKTISCSFSMAHMNSFSELMTGGRSYIALAAVSLGQYKLAGVLLASLMFGASNALQYNLQASITKFPAPIIRIIPYVITIIAVIISGGNSKDPSSLGKKYVKFS